MNPDAGLLELLPHPLPDRPRVAAAHRLAARAQRQGSRDPGAGEADHEERPGRQRRTRDHPCIERQEGARVRGEPGHDRAGRACGGSRAKAGGDRAKARRGTGGGSEGITRGSFRGRLGRAHARGLADLAALELEALGLQQPAHRRRVAERGAPRVPSDSARGGRRVSRRGESAG